MARPIKGAPSAAAAVLALSVGACGHNPFTTASWSTRNSHSERECLARAMYFESNRSSEDGMTAVGTVVMNRLQSGRYPKTVCGVVGQPNQFADGALSKPVGGKSWALALAKADAVLAGERHSQVGAAMHFHTAGYTFPYRNMAYVVAAGGNVFYEKRTPGTFQPVNPNVLVAQADRERRRPSNAILLARAEETAPQEHRAERRLERPVTRTRLAALEDRDERREAQNPRLARPKVTRHDSEDAPRGHSRGERIRLAHLDDDEMPKALRQRSDAVPAGRMGGIPLAYKTPAAAPERGRIAPKAPAVQAAAFRPLAAAAHAARPGAKAEPRYAAAAKPLSTRPRGADPLPLRPAKAKPEAPASAAKLGWRKGPEPAASPGKNRPKKT